MEVLEVFLTLTFGIIVVFALGSFLINTSSDALRESTKLLDESRISYNDDKIIVQADFIPDKVIFGEVIVEVKCRERKDLPCNQENILISKSNVVGNNYEIRIDDITSGQIYLVENYDKFFLKEINEYS